MIKKGDQIRIIEKLDEYTTEYEIGDQFVVDGIWYGGVHIIGKTGVPISLEEKEFEKIEPEMGKEKSEKKNTKNVIFHMNEEQRFSMVYANIQNMLDFYNEKKEALKVELLINGEAIKMLKESEKRELLLQLKKEGITIAICKNSMTGHGISEEEGQEFLVIPAGVVELAEKQWEGYAYIRP